jgi:hypothetical protein
VVVTTSLKLALYWMNIYRELLAVNGLALHRMRDLIAHSDWPDEHESDVQVVAAEIKRVRDRLAYWEDIVDRANAVALRAG